MPCKCGSVKIIEINGKCGDLFSVKELETGRTREGYIPSELGLGHGDYINFRLCLSCMTIQTPLLASEEIETILSELFE